MKFDQVHKINISHNYDKIVNDVLIKYKNSYGLPSISNPTLLDMLLKDKKDAMYEFAKSLLDMQELAKHQEFIIRTSILKL